MEFLAFKQCMEFLIAYGLTIATFISDRHVSIAIHMKTVLSRIVHYFDIWHNARSIGKKMLQLGKEKGCEKIADWVKRISNHLYWCATSYVLHRLF